MSIEDIAKSVYLPLAEDTGEYFMGKTREEYLIFFRHMEDEHKKEALNGMAYDEVDWWIHDAVEVDKLFTLEELHELFPILIKSQEQIERDKIEWKKTQEWMNQQP